MQNLLKSIDGPLLLRFFLSLLVLALFTIAVMTGEAADWAHEALIMLVASVIYWWFGSSKGSSDKTVVIANGRHDAPAE